MTQPSPTSDTRSTRFRWITGSIVALMIVLMVYSGNPLNPQGRMASGTKLGTAAGGDVMSENVQYANNLYEALQSIYVVVPPISRDQPEPQVVPLLAAAWGEPLTRDVKLNPEALYLALRESRAVSPGTSPFALGPLEPERQSPDAPGAFNNGYVDLADLRPMPTSLLGQYYTEAGRSFPVELRVVRRDKGNRVSQLSPNTLPPLEQANVYAALNDFLTIQSAASLPLNALKPSTPMVERLIASNSQAFTLQVAAFDASAFVASVPEPTEAQLQAHFAAHAGRAPGTPDRSHPFGFGYRVPDRVRLQLISLRRDDVRKLVEAEKTPYEWEVAARIAFTSDPTLAAAATQPTSRPASQPTSQPATAPAARFEDVRDRAIAATIDRAVDARLADIERAIRLRMAQDYQAYSAARATNAATQPTSLGVAYDAADYLDKLAEDIARTFKVTPVVEHYDDRPRDGDALTLIGGFNAATREIPPALAARYRRASTRITGPEYAILFAKELMEPAAADLAGELALDRFEPSDRLELTRDGRAAEVYYFRLTAAEPNHPGTDLAAVRERVTSDWRVAEAQRLTLERATAAAAALAAGGDLAAVGAPVTTVTVGPFGSTSDVPPGLDLSLPAYAQFAAQVTQKLLADSGPQPVAALDVPLAGKAYVARRVDVTPLWSSVDELTGAAQAIRAQYLSAMSRPKTAGNPLGLTPFDLAATWIEPKRVFERNAWQPIGGNDNGGDDQP